MTISFRVCCRAVLCLMLVLVLGLPVASAAHQQEQVAQQTPGTELAKPKWLGIQIQDLDEPLTLFVPKTPRTQAEIDAVDAAAHLATGQMLENRNELEKAYNEYNEGFKKSPNSLLLIRKLMALALMLSKQEEGIEFAQKALALNPTDVRALREIGKVLSADDPATAIEMFERAVKLPNLSHQSPMYVTLMLDLGVLYRGTNRTAEAAECFAVVFDAILNNEKYKLSNDVRRELRANTQVGFEKLGQVFLDAGKSDLALQAFQKAAESRTGSAGSHSYNLAQVYLQTKQPEKAMEELNKYFASQRQIKGRAAYELLGQILKAQGKPEDLIPRLLELSAKDSRNTTLAFFLGGQLVAAKRFDEAEQLFKKGLSTAADPEGYRGLIQVYREQNKPKELIEVLSKMFAGQKSLDGIESELQLVVESPELLQSLVDTGLTAIKTDKPEIELNTLYVLARIAGRGQKLDAAEQLYHYLIGQRRASEWKSRLYDELGDLLMEAKRFADAAKLLQDGVKDPDVDDEKPNLIYNLSRAYELDGKTKEALDVIADGQKNFPNQQHIFRFQEAWVYYHAAQYEKAIELFEKLIVDYKPLPLLVKNAKSSLSNIYVLTGQIEKGEKILEEMYDKDKHDPGINNDLGYLYADQGKKLEEAEAMIRKAVKADPDNSAYLDSLAWVLYKRGKYPEALANMEKALVLSQAKQSASDATLWDHLGDIQEQLKNIEKAVDAWKKALAAAKADSKPDTKLIGKLEDKLKNRTSAPGNTKAERQGTP